MVKLILLVLSAVALFSLLPLSIFSSTIFMGVLLLLALMYIKARKPCAFSKWMTVAVSGFVIGAASDYTMNIIAQSRKPNSPNPNWTNMKTYFDSVGTTDSFLFAGMLTAWMTVNTFALMFSDSLLTTLFIGFLVGAGWGVVVESLHAKAAEPLMVFYNNTPGGYVENRLWDGATILLSSGVTFFVLLSLDL